VDGGTHPGGTRNAVVLCQDGATYVELLTVHDPIGPMARWLSQMLAGGDRWCGWAVRTDDIEKVAARLGVSTHPGSIERADGTVGSWTVAGNRRTAADSYLPFFIDYGASPPIRTAPPNAPLAVAWIEVTGERDRLSEWLGSEVPGVRVIAGTPGMRAVGLATHGDEIELRLGHD
jgi:Glyoxalase-like domain